MIDIRHDKRHTDSIVEGSGTLDQGLSIEYYQSNTFTNVNSKTNTIGNMLYPQISWSVKSLVTKVFFFINTCRIRDVDEHRKWFEVIHETCFSETVQARPLGAAFDDAERSKRVTENSQFQYISFSFNYKSKSQQEMICDVRFCLFNDA